MSNYLKGQLAIGWANVAIGEKSVSNEADRIANELMMGMKDLDRKDRELIKDWIYEGVHAGKEISGEILSHDRRTKNNNRRNKQTRRDVR